MKVVILAGGYGTRISEESALKPKPMICIGEQPILWHIMKIYSHYGFNDFVILLGYKGHVIKDYFTNYFMHQCDMCIDIKNNQINVLNKSKEHWNITLLETGLETMTGGRILRAKEHIGNEPFMLTYGDGLSDIDINELLKFHKSHGKAITMTSIQPEGRFGVLDIQKNGQISKFNEKPKDENQWINGGFFVCEPKVFDYIKEGDKTIFERNPLESLAADEELFAYKHKGFWLAMDTLRDKNQMTDLWIKNEAAWKVW